MLVRCRSERKGDKIFIERHLGFNRYAVVKAHPDDTVGVFCRDGITDILFLVGKICTVGVLRDVVDTGVEIREGYVFSVGAKV